MDRSGELIEETNDLLLILRLDIMIVASEPTGCIWIRDMALSHFCAYFDRVLSMIPSTAGIRLQTTCNDN